MTVTYTSEVAEVKGISPFLKLLARWRGSIYKIVWSDLLLFLGTYYALSALYNWGLEGEDKKNFETIVKYCNKYGNLIPLSFVLGFYVNVVFTRWWNQYTSIPFPDNLAILVGASIKGQDDRARIIRRTIVRYVCVTFVITLTMMSPKVKKRFPTLNHFIEAGLITEDEKKIMEDMDIEYPGYSKYWLPLAWASNLVTRGRHEGLIRDDMSVRTILEELNGFRSKCGSMLDFDWISVPLVYTQVVTLAVYTYFVITVFANQYIDSENSEQHINLYFPIMPVLEFFFYMGWLKVAETLINPFGEDDDDFEVCWLVDRHVQVCYLLVDKIHHSHPRLMKDYYWNEVSPNFLPYTLATQDYITERPIESTKNIKLKKKDLDVIHPDFTETDGKKKGNAIQNIFYRKRVSNNVRLREIQTTKPENQDKQEELVNTYETQGPQGISFEIDSAPKPVPIVEDFEKLKRERLQQKRERMLKYIKLLKENAEESKLIEELLK